MPNQTRNPRIDSTPTKTGRNGNNKPNQSSSGGSQKLCVPDKTKKIVEQDKDGSINKDSVKEARRGIAKQREKDQKEELQKILGGEQLGLYEKKRIEKCLEKGASNWLSALPLKEAGFSLNKLEFRDAIALQYDLPVPSLPKFCACGNLNLNPNRIMHRALNEGTSRIFTRDHAMICKTDGFVPLRHDELLDLTGNMLSEVCRNVDVERLLQPLTGEKLKYQISIKEDNARLGLSALGFWRHGEKAFFDIRVFDPVAQSYFNQNLQAAHLRQENEKRRQYEERVLHVEHASFTPLIFTIAGGMGKAAQKCFSRLAESRGQPKSIVTAWMRCCLSFSRLRSAILCIRGTRNKSRQIVEELHYTDFEVDARVGRINRSTHG